MIEQQLAQQIGHAVYASVTVLQGFDADVFERFMQQKVYFA